jgi:hypothetical protein
VKIEATGTSKTLLPISDVFQRMWSYISISGSSFVMVLEEPEWSWLSAVSFKFRHWYFAILSAVVLYIRCIYIKL